MTGKHCTLVLESDIMTYADLRYSTGRIYRDVFGMNFEGEASPGFFWANSKLETRNRLTLINQIVRNEGETQEAAARRLGWFKIFDCGNLKFSSKPRAAVEDDDDLAFFKSLAEDE